MGRIGLFASRARDRTHTVGRTIRRNPASVATPAVLGQVQVTRSRGVGVTEAVRAAEMSPCFDKPCFYCYFIVFIDYE